ncbi:unnamed protein product [Sphagnum jensenii]|uniref:PGG domain-containing protein n=1 Tax=Sphagnum jensenii TaxID=128206 RepID=A0ABP1BA71_9BRYO
MDAYLHAIVSYYDELFGHLHWFNLAQKQLFQAICDDASEADLRARLDSTLLDITDGANEEQGDFAELSWEEQWNGKAKLGPELPDVLARGRVYDKALGEARHNIRIEKFLVMQLEKDANLTDYLSLNLPEVRCIKIACWAATCNLVHMVMGLINCRGEGDRKFLYRVLDIAVEFGYVELVERLAELAEGVKSHVCVFDNDFEDIYLRGMGKNIQRLDGSGCLYYYAFRDKLEPIQLAAKLGNVEMFNTLLACRKFSLHFTKPLHWAAKMGKIEVVNAILGNQEEEFFMNRTCAMTVRKSRIGRRHRFATQFIRWDGSKIGPFDLVRFTPLQLASLHGHVNVVKALCNDEKGRLGAMKENIDGVTALQIATEMQADEIVKVLTDIPEVAKDVKRLYRDRQVHVDAANAILVGAALISSVTFAGWLQPPLDSPFFGSASLDAGAPPPSGMYPSFVSVEGHPIMKIFWVFNSLSFFFAIATLMVGATAARPPKKETYIGETVRCLQSSLRLAYGLLTVSVACVMGAFASAGFVVLPPIHSYTTVMQATVSIGVMVVFLAWTSSTVFNVLTSIQIKIRHRLWGSYYSNP